MNEFLFSLGTATLFLGGGFIIATILLKATRCRSWRLRRLTWSVVLLLGVVPLFGIQWTLYVPITEPEARDTEPEASAREQPVDAAQPPLSLWERARVRAVSPAEDIELTNIDTSSVEMLPLETAPNELPAALTLTLSQRERGRYSMPTPSIAFDKIIVSIWLLGVVVILFRTAIRSLRFHRSLRESAPADAKWSTPWTALQAEYGVKKKIPMLANDSHGPALVRRPFGFVLVVPLEGWDNLSEVARIGVAAAGVDGNGISASDFRSEHFGACVAIIAIRAISPTGVDHEASVFIGCRRAVVQHGVDPRPTRCEKCNTKSRE